jgi:hypothetical protein
MSVIEIPDETYQAPLVLTNAGTITRDGQEIGHVPSETEPIIKGNTTRFSGGVILLTGTLTITTHKKNGA